MHFRKLLSTSLTITLIAGSGLAPISSASTLPNSAMKSSANHNNNNNNSNSNSSESKVMTRSMNNTAAVPLVEQYLQDGRLAEGERAVKSKLKEDPKNDNERFGLGVLQFLSAVERLSQDFHHYGLRDQSSRGISLPILRLP
ncbi:MAG: hypothetical protein K2X27_12395, partial [Candidatus Obscuribacterales bacterium]|nr:hypothetical protein [Candidatus Obscuribacterales bacterium]